MMKYSPDSPSSARFGGRIRPAFAMCLVGVLILVSAMIAGILWVMETRYSREIKARHARGEKILPQDFAAPEIPDEENAATFLNEAASTLGRLDAKHDWMTQHVRGRRFVPAQAEYAREFLIKHDTALDLVRVSRLYPKINWHTRIATTPLDTAFKYVQGQRMLAITLYLIAIYQHEMGNDRAAVESVRDILSIVRALDQQPSIATHAVATGLTPLACDALIRMAPTLRVHVIADSASPEGAFTPADREIITSLIKELLDDGPRQTALIEGWNFDRMAVSDSFRNASANRIMQHLLSWKAVNDMREYNVAIAASRAQNWHGVQSTIANSSKYVSEYNSGQFARTIEHHWKRTVERRVAATALAMRLFQIDHDSAWPASIAELAPAYLQSIPIDPFSPEDRPLGYIPGGRPSIYSVGVDEFDQGGNSADAIDEDGIYNAWLAVDAVFTLGGVLNESDWDPEPPVREAGFAGVAFGGRARRVER